MPAPRVLLVTDVTEPGGVGTHLRHLASAGRVARWDVAVLMDSGSSTDGMARMLAEAGIPTDRAAIYRTHASEGEIRAVVSRAYARFGPDIIHVHCGSPRSAVLPRLVALEMGVPLVVTEHFVWPELVMTESLTATLQQIYRRAQAVISVCRENRRLLRERFRLLAPCHRVIQSSVEIPTKPSLRRTSAPPYRALTVARFAPQKGLDILIRAVALLHREEREQMGFTVVGGGALHDELVTLAARLGVVERFAFMGWRDNVPALIEAHDLFILPSRAEGQPLTLLEALGAGLPCIASAVSGIPEALGGGRYGALVMPDDPADLARAISAFLHTPVELQQKAIDAWPHLRRCHALTENMSKVIDMWMSAAANRNTANQPHASQWMDSPANTTRHGPQPV